MELYEEIEKRENAIKIIEMHTAGEPTRIGMYNKLFDIRIIIIG